MSDLRQAIERSRGGGPERHREKAHQQGKLPVRERVARLVDDGSFSEEAMLANWFQDGLGADGVVTGTATLEGRPIAVMANDPTVKAGSWGPKTVEKIVRIQEQALRQRIPMVYLVDSAGALVMDEAKQRIEALHDEIGAQAQVGFHGHQNLSLGVANSVLAFQTGARQIDGALCALGAGAGNSPTEVLAATFERLGVPTGITMVAGMPRRRA